MSLTHFAILILIIVVISVISVKIQKHARLKNEQNLIKKEETRVRMASLRERKEQKKQERLALEAQKKQERLALEAQKKQEQEALEEQRKQELLRLQVEQKKRIEDQNKALNKLGLVEKESDEDEEEYIEGYGYTTLEYQTNEYFDIDKFFKYVNKYGLEDESFKLWIIASSGNSMYFACNAEESIWFARIGEGAVKKFQSKKALRNYV